MDIDRQVGRLFDMYLDLDVINSRPSGQDWLALDVAPDSHRIHLGTVRPTAIPQKDPEGK